MIDALCTLSAEKNKRNNETEEVRKSLLQIHVLDEENKNLEQSLHHRKQGIFADNDFWFLLE